MRAIFLAIFLLLLTVPGPAEAQSETAGDFVRYDVAQLQRINRAIDIFHAAGSDLADYDVVFYEEKEELYLITFTTDVVFAEDGPVRGPEIQMLFNAETEALIAVEVHPIQTPPAKD
ncbi:MAG: hypothetical protein AAF965_00085 [Pseudomonadota bacterium]